MRVESHLPASELVRLERCEKSAERARRLRIVMLATTGWTAPAVAMATGLSRRVCQEWVARFNEFGLSGLEDRRGRQSRSPLTPEQETAVRHRIEAGPTDVDQVCSLRGQDFQRILAEEFGVQRSLAAVYDLLHSLGYSYVRPRPIHRKSEPVARERFKQDWPETLQSIAALHPGKPHYIPANSGEFTFRTNHVWASKGLRPVCGPRKGHAPRLSGRPSRNICG